MIIKSIMTAEEQVELENNAEKIVKKMPQVVVESISQYIESIRYRSYDERDFRHGLSCYLDGLADAGLITYKEETILNDYVDMII